MVGLALGIFAYLTKEKPSTADKISDHDTHGPRAVLEDFVFFRYRGAYLESRLQAIKGQFLEPNRVKLDGDIRGWRFRENREESMAAQSMIAFFDSKTIGELFTHMELVKTEMQTEVSVGTNDHILRTDYAEFLAPENLIVSDLPVRVEGPNRWFTGQKGFRYDLKSEEVAIFGDVQGVIIPHENGANAEKR